MADLPTRTDLFDRGAREMIARSAARAPGKRIAPEAIYTEGTDVNVLVAGASAMAEEVLRQHARSEAAKYYDSARGDDLDRLVLDRTSREVPRKEAAPAYVDVTFTRTSGAMAAVTLEAYQRVKTKSAIAFELLASATLSAGQAGPVTVTARAVLAGSQCNVGQGAITEIENSPDPELTVTNLEVAAGGREREQDRAYVERARAWRRAQRCGTTDAVLFGTLTVPTVAFANVEEELDLNGDATGRVFVYVTDASGQANAELVRQVKDGLREYRCCGIVPYVIGAVPEYADIVWRLRFAAGTDTQQAFDQLRAATVAVVNATSPGKPLEASLLVSLARRVPGIIVRDDVLAQPLGDLYPSAPGRVIRTTTDRVTLVAP
jgi:uncharacterized phage protein gp47/JayE